AQTTFTNPAGIGVPYGLGPAATYPSQITFSGLPGTIVSMKVNLIGLTHTGPADLDVLLVGPTGVAVILMSDAGGGNPIQGISLFFADSGGPLPASNLTTGLYQPTNFPDAVTGPDVFPAPAPPGPYGSALSA